MANQLSVKLTVDGGAARREISAIEGGLTRINTAAFAAGKGIDAFASSARSSASSLSLAYREARNLATAYGLVETAAVRAARSAHQARRAFALDQTGGSRLSPPGETAFGSARSFVGGIVTAQGASFAAGQLQAGIEGYRERAAAERFLSSASTLSGTSLSRNQAIAQRFGAQYGLSQAQANQVVAQASRFTGAAGRPEDTERFLQRLADLAAATGQSLSDLPTLISQISAGTDEATDKLLAANPSVIYERYAASVGKTAAALSEAEKRQSLMNAVIADGGMVTGAATRQLDTVLGRYDRLVTKLGELRTAFVEAALESGPYQDASRGLTSTANFLTDTAAGRGTLAAVSQLGLLGLGEVFATGQRAVDLISPGGERATGAAVFGGRGPARPLSPAAIAELTRAGVDPARLGNPYGGLANLSPAEQRRRIADDVTTRFRSGFGDLSGGGRDPFGGSSAAAFADLRGQLDQLRQRYTGQSNPLVAILQAGRTEAARLAEDIKNLPLDRQAYGPGLLREQARGVAFQYASGIPSAVREISSLGARYNEITAARFLADGTVGYGRETGREQIDRVLTDAGRIEQLTARILGRQFDATDTARLSRRFRNDLIVSEFAGLDPNSELLDPQTRGLYADALRETSTDRIRQLAESLAVNESIRSATEKIGGDVAEMKASIEQFTDLFRGVDPRVVEAAVVKLGDGITIELVNRTDKQAQLSRSTLFSGFDPNGDPTLESNS